MMDKLEVLNDFHRLSGKLLERKILNCERLDDYSLLFSPKGEQIDLVFLSLVHGNEVGSLLIINTLLDALLKEDLLPEISFAISLGNVEAYKKGVRFIDRDLNRSYGRKENTLHEDQVAKRLEKIILRANYVFDLHQTSSPSLSPFFIFRYKEEMVNFAKGISKDTPIVTFKGEPFYTEGTTTTEFVRRNGKISVTLELGEAGFSPEQTAHGFVAVLNALDYVADPIEFPVDEDELFHTWVQKVVVAPDAHFLPGFKNFAPVRKGDLLCEDKGEKILANHDGKILFPTYEIRNSTSHEFCRIIIEKPLKEL